MFKFSLSAVLLFSATAFAAAPGELPPDTPLVVGKDASVKAIDFEAGMARIPEQHRPAIRMSQDKISTIVDGLFIGKSIANKARAAGMDKDPIVQKRLEQAQDQILADLYLRKLEAEAKIPNLEQRAREIYNGDPKRFSVPEQVYVQQILVGYNERTPEMAMARAKELETQVRQPGQDFMTLARSTTEDPDRRRNGGDLGWYAMSSFEPEIIAWLATVKDKDSISPPIRTFKGIHILKFIGRQPVRVKSYDEVKKGLLDEERGLVIKNVRDDAINAVRNDPAVVVHAANVEALRIPVDPSLLTPLAPEAVEAAKPRMKPTLPK